MIKNKKSGTRNHEFWKRHTPCESSYHDSFHLLIIWMGKEPMLEHWNHTLNHIIILKLPKLAADYFSKLSYFPQHFTGEIFPATSFPPTGSAGSLQLFHNGQERNLLLSQRISRYRSRFSTHHHRLADFQGAVTKQFQPAMCCSLYSAID